MKENKQMNLGLLLAIQQTFSSLIHSVPRAMKATFGVSQVQGGSPISINNQDQLGPDNSTIETLSPSDSRY